MNVKTHREGNSNRPIFSGRLRLGAWALEGILSSGSLSLQAVTPTIRGWAFAVGWERRSPEV